MHTKINYQTKQVEQIPDTIQDCIDTDYYGLLCENELEYTEQQVFNRMQAGIHSMHEKKRVCGCPDLNDLDFNE